MQIYLGSINIYRVNGGIRAIVDSDPFLSPDYDELEGNGETLTETLEDLQEQMERLPQ